MVYVWMVLGWLFALFFGLFTVSMLLLKNWLNAFVLILLVLLCLPPVNALMKAKLGLTIHPLLRVVLIGGLLFLFIKLLTGGEVTSIYSTPEVKQQVYASYDEKMEEWPVPYEDVFLDTQYGVVHVIVSGPEDAPALMLLHASGVASWSWKSNIQALAPHYRVYAIDLVGDAGKSEYASLEHIMQTGQDQAELYAEIMDKLGIEQAYVAGASEGGFIATNLALHHPERVKKLGLFAPMGYSGAVKSIIRIAFTSMFPLKPIQDSTFAWAFSDSQVLKEQYAEWFPLLMTGVISKKVAPMPFSAEERQRLQVPVMFVFGTRDNLVGNPQVAKDKVQDIAGVRVEIVEAGHLMCGELPEKCNQFMLDYFGTP